MAFDAVTNGSLFPLDKRSLHPPAAAEGLGSILSGETQAKPENPLDMGFWSFSKTQFRDVVLLSDVEKTGFSWVKPMPLQTSEAAPHTGASRRFQPWV